MVATDATLPELREAFDHLAADFRDAETEAARLAIESHIDDVLDQRNDLASA